MRSATKLEGERSFFVFFHHGEAIRVTRALGIKRIKKKIHYNNHVTTTVDGSCQGNFGCV